eukprot:1939482-Prymnesium_polylepis.1
MSKGWPRGAEASALSWLSCEPFTPTLNEILSLSARAPRRWQPYRLLLGRPREVCRVGMSNWRSGTSAPGSMLTWASRKERLAIWRL